MLYFDIQNVTFVLFFITNVRKTWQRYYIFLKYAIKFEQKAQNSAFCKLNLAKKYNKKLAYIKKKYYLCTRYEKIHLIYYCARVCMCARGEALRGRRHIDVAEI